MKKQKTLICATQARSIILYLKVQPSILLCKLLGLIVAEEIISEGLNSTIQALLDRLDISDSPKSSELGVLPAQELGDFWFLLRPETRTGYA